MVGSNMWDLNKGWTDEEMTYGQTRHPFTRSCRSQKMDLRN